VDEADGELPERAVAGAVSEDQDVDCAVPSLAGLRPEAVEARSLDHKVLALPGLLGFEVRG